MVARDHDLRFAFRFTKSAYEALSPARDPLETRVGIHGSA